MLSNKTLKELNKILSDRMLFTRHFTSKEKRNYYLSYTVSIVILCTCAAMYLICFYIRRDRPINILILIGLICILIGIIMHLRSIRPLYHNRILTEHYPLLIAKYGDNKDYKTITQIIRLQKLKQYLSHAGYIISPETYKAINVAIESAKRMELKMPVFKNAFILIIGALLGLASACLLEYNKLAYPEHYIKNTFILCASMGLLFLGTACALDGIISSSIDSFITNRFKYLKHTILFALQRSLSQQNQHHTLVTLLAHKTNFGIHHHCS